MSETTTCRFDTVDDARRFIENLLARGRSIESMTIELDIGSGRNELRVWHGPGGNEELVDCRISLHSVSNPAPVNSRPEEAEDAREIGDLRVFAARIPHSANALLVELRYRDHARTS